MGVYIKGMEMPKNCMLCPLCVEEADPANGEMCMVTGTLMPPCTRERLDNCPLAPVPPHGDLIDKKTVSENLASVLSKKNPPFSFPDWNDAVVAALTAPTIIPAEEGE